MINKNGKAIPSDMVCTDERPPVTRNPTASREMTTHQVTFLLVDGFSSPSDVNIPRTKDPESAEVIRNVNSKTTAITDSTTPTGYSFRMVTKLFLVLQPSLIMHPEKIRVLLPD